MKRNIFISLVWILLVMMTSTGVLFGQEDGFTDIFGTDEAVESEEDIISDGGYTSGVLNVNISGEIGLTMKSYLNEGLNSEFTTSPRMKLDIAPVAGDLEGFASFKVDDWTLDPDVAPEEMIDEMYLRYFFSAGYLEAGLKKVEWGKGDGIHVIDNINPLNQSGGIVPDINEMKDPMNMVKLNLYTGANGLAEFIYIPMFEGYTIADDGRWALVNPADFPNLTIRERGGIADFTGAIRYTTVLGSMDLGGQYYYGYKPEPGYKVESEFTGTDPYDPTHYTVSTELVYTRAHLFGLEAGWAAGPFTFRAEAGYWLTEDFKGDQPELYNNSLVCLGGVDFTLPGTNLFFSIQATETYVINYNDLTDTDVDFLAAYDDKPTTTNIIPALDLPFGKEKFKLRIGGVYLVEAGGWMATQELFYYPVDDMEISVSGQLFGGEKDSHYKTWKDNGNIALEFKYIF
ncbi:MAG: hypothetical protein JEY99_01110 [Spirochaetales bacterium]|nr:hypothetical protein [Spirochaetales bacterium]